MAEFNLPANSVVNIARRRRRIKRVMRCRPHFHAALPLRIADIVEQGEVVGRPAA